MLCGVASLGPGFTRQSAVSASGGIGLMWNFIGLMVIFVVVLNLSADSAFPGLSLCGC